MGLVLARVGSMDFEKRTFAPGSTDKALPIVHP
jgi:hypothetical protein